LKDAILNPPAIVRPAGTLAIPGFTLSRTGLLFDGEPTYEQWLEAGKLLRLMEGSVHWAIGDWLSGGERRYGEKYAEAVEATGFSPQTLMNDKWVAERVEFSRRRENLTFSHHAEVAPLPPAEQKRWLAKAEKEDWARFELRAAVRKERLAATRAACPLPAGKYRVLYADPPWKYNDERTLVDGYGPAERHYPTMTIDELCELGVGDLAADDAVLFLWVTVPIFHDSIRVIDAWGFTYKSFFLWDKVKHNFGKYNSVRSEVLQVCTRGSCTPDSARLYDNVVTIERSNEHSEKPEEFRKMIDQLYSEGPRIELFARRKADGWDAWGNELPAAQDLAG
jgi:N6-adenosine-specific RNA methylase IME4